MRQNEREIKFIRVGDAVGTAGQLKGEPTLNGGLSSTFIPRVQGVGQGSRASFADRMRHVYWAEGRVGQIPSPCGLGGETGYTVVLQHAVEGRMTGSGFSASCIPRPSLVLSALLYLVHHTLLWRPRISASFTAPSNCL